MKSMLLVLSLSFLICTSTMVDGKDTSDPVIAAMIEKMDMNNLYNTAENLQSIPTREYGTDGNEEAASYLYSELSNIPGLSIEYADGDLKNIVGTLPGIDASAEEVFMIGAHYDSTSSDPDHAPGATDNAIGVAIVLEMARVMSQYQFNHSIGFAFWNSEEHASLGSSAYANSAFKKSMKIPLYYNFDSSGYDPENTSVLDIMYDDQSSWAKDMIAQANYAYGINFTLAYNAHSCTSDHLSFRSSGYPAVMTHSPSHGSSHTSDDTIDKVSIDYALKNGKLGMALIAQLAEVQISKTRISVNKAADPIFGSPGTNVTFTLNVTNSGNEPLVNVFLADLLPNEMSYISSSPTGIIQGRNISWSDIGPMEAGAIKKLEIVAKIDGPIAGSKNLTNHAQVSGRSQSGLNATANASAEVRVNEAKITVIKTADPPIGSKGTNVTYSLNLTNDGNASLSHVFISDRLPDGMEYIDSSEESIVEGRYVNWTDIGQMEAGTSKSLWIRAEIDGTVFGNLTNKVEVRGSPDHGKDITSSDAATVEAKSAYLNVTDEAMQDKGFPGSVINYTMVISNTGSADLCQVSASDILPQGLKYEWDDHDGVLTEQNKVIWDNLGCLKTGEKIQVQMAASIIGTVLGDLDNRIVARASPSGNGKMVESEAHSIVSAISPPLNVTKTSDRLIYSPEEEMNYSITICNPLEYFSLKDVAVNDAFQNPDAKILSSSLETSNQGQWHISEIPPAGCVTIRLVAMYLLPDSLSDNAESITITNSVNATAKAGDESLSGSDNSTITINLLPINEAPDAVNDTATTDEDEAVMIPALGNDISPSGNPLKIDSVSDPTDGSAAINSDGNITYTPDADFCGTDIFNYTITDGKGGFDTAAVTIPVRCVNDDPNAIDDAYSVEEDTTLIVPAPGMLGNDGDIDEDSLNVTSNTNPIHGTAKVDANGTLTYIPTDNYNGIESFEYTISDGKGGSDTATINIIVQSINDRPKAVDDSATAEEGSSLTISVLGNDADPDGDYLTVDSITQPSSGTAVLNEDGTITYNPNADFCGTDSFNYSIIDGQGESDTATARVTVSCINDNPEAFDDTYEMDEDMTLTMPAPGVLANDMDSDGDSLSVISSAAPSRGTVTVNADGSLKYRPITDYNGQDSFTYTISDGQGGSDIAEVTIDVAPVNDGPHAFDDTAITVEETPIDISVKDNDLDPEEDPLLVDSISDPGHGTVMNNGDGTVTYTPDLKYCDPDNPDRFNYTISDGQGGTDTAMVIVTVDCTSEASIAPEAVDDEAVTDEEVPVTISLLDNDADPDGDPISMDGFAQPANGKVIDNGDGTVTYKPNKNFCGDIDRFEYTISDGQGGFDTATVTVSVNCVNVCPVASDDEYRAVYGKKLVAGIDKSILRNDEDDDGDRLTAELITGPIHGILELNPDGSFNYKPEMSFVGTDTFTYRAFDGKCHSDPTMVTLTTTAAKCTWFIKNELYTAICGDKKEVAASEGILANDHYAVAVLNPDEITIDPKYGTIDVEEDGSFVYDAASNITSGTYVQFKYRATNGICEAKYQGIAKMQVVCHCKKDIG